MRGGASGAGRCRAEPSRAEPRGAGERQAEPAGGSAPIVLRFPARCLPAFAQAPAKLLLSRAPPGCVTKSQRSAVATLAGTGDRGGRATLARRRALAPCASSPADCSRESRGGTPKRTARASAPRNPVHRCGPARRNFNLIPVAHPGHPRRPPPPPSLRSHKERGEGRRRGRRARASGLPRQKGNCHRSGRLFRPVVGSSSRPGLPLRLSPCGLCPQSSDPASCGARVAAAGWGSRDNK